MATCIVTESTATAEQTRKKIQGSAGTLSSTNSMVVGPYKKWSVQIWPIYPPITKTLRPVLGLQQTFWPWAPCVPCGLWGPQGAHVCAKLHWGGTSAHVGLVRAWGFAHTYHAGSAPHAMRKPSPQNGQKPAHQPKRGDVQAPP